MIPLLLLLPLLFLLAVYGKDSKKEESRVVVIAIDGLRWQEVFEGARRDSLMPFLWEMGRKKGCMIGNRNRKSKMEVANGIWKSYAGYSEMLCGVTDDEHIFDNRKQYNLNRSVLELAEACSEYKDRVSAVASWVARLSVSSSTTIWLLILRLSCWFRSHMPAVPATWYSV